MYAIRSYYVFKTGETYMDKFAYGQEKFVHRVNLISLTKDLTRKPLENMTLQQPKGDFGLYSRSINVGETRISNTLTPFTIPFNNVVNSNLTKINGLQLVSLESFNVSVLFSFKYLPTIIDLNLTVNVRYNNVIVIV